MFVFRKLTRWTAGRSEKPANTEIPNTEIDVRLPLHVENRDLDAAVDDMLARYPSVLAALTRGSVDQLANQIEADIASAFEGEFALSPHDHPGHQPIPPADAMRKSARELAHDHA